MLARSLVLSLTVLSSAWGFAPSPLSPSLRAGSASTAARSSRCLATRMQMNPASSDLSRRDLLAGSTAAALAASGLLSPLSAFAEEKKFPVGSSRRPVVVVGAGGKTGKLIVQSLVNKGGYGIRACVRGEITNDELGEGCDDVDIRTGVDVTKYETLGEGSGAVIFASSASKKGGNAEAVDCIGVENVAKACLEANVERLVVVSSCAVTRPDSLGYKFTNILGNIMDYKEQGEERLRNIYKGQTDKTYTVVRPGGLKDGKGKGLDKMLVVQGDTIFGEIDRVDLAEVAVASVFAPQTFGTTFEVFMQDGAKPLAKEYEKDPYFVSGKHTTTKAFDPEKIIKGKNEEAVTELFNGLKKDTEYDAANGYKAKKPAKSA